MYIFPQKEAYSINAVLEDELVDAEEVVKLAASEITFETLVKWLETHSS